jgi:tetratricopeptide (TPR) repeat protein
VGDIHQRLGQPELAEQAYRRTIEKLLAIDGKREAAEQIATELARSYNEIGNVRSNRLDAASAFALHQQALSTLLSRQTDGERSASFQYELARTLYLLTNSMPTASAVPDVRGAATVVSRQPIASFRRSDYRRQASRILEDLVRQHDRAPGYRYLLALCRRPLRPVTLNSRDAPARQNAIEILQQLTAEYPDVADYRYELATTYAWLHVGLYPWETRVTAGRDVEPALRTALDEAQRLVDQNPSIPHYARSLAVILAKLGTVCWTNDRLPEARAFFLRAFETQVATVEQFPDIPSHNRVLCEFLRLRLAQVDRELLGGSEGKDPSHDVVRQLDICIDNLTLLHGRPELAEDRLARFALREACSVRSSLETTN